MTDPTTEPDEGAAARTAARTALAAEYVNLAAQIETLEERKAALRAALLTVGPGTAGELKVTITQSKRLNATRFAIAYPVEEHPDYYESKPKAAIAKALGDASCYDLDAPSVRITEA